MSLAACIAGSQPLSTPTTTKSRREQHRGVGERQLDVDFTGIVLVGRTEERSVPMAEVSA